MVKFLEVDPNAVETQAMTTSRGGVIGPLIQGFLKTGFFMCEIDASEIGRKPASVSASIAAYAVNHIVPVRPILRTPHLFLQRRDVDKDGNEIPDWKDELLKNFQQGTKGKPLPQVPTISFESVSLEDQKNE